MFLFVVVFGLFFGWVSVKSFRRAQEIQLRGLKAEAVVVEIAKIQMPSTQGGTSTKGYQAIYSYKDQAGNEHRKPGNRKSTRKSVFSLGERKTVVFDPDSPSEVVDAGLNVYTGAALYLFVALAMMAFGVVGFIYDW